MNEQENKSDISLALTHALSLPVPKTGFASGISKIKQVYFCYFAHLALSL